MKTLLLIVMLVTLLGVLASFQLYRLGERLYESRMSPKNERQYLESPDDYLG